MQALSHTYELNELLSSTKCKKVKNDKSVDTIILNEWNDLRTVIWNNNGTVSPNRFVHFVQQVADSKGRELFTGWAQNDMPEFLLFIIECIHNSISRKMTMKITGNIENGVDNLAIACYKMLQTTYAKEYSEIMELFYGIYVSELKSVDDNTTQNAKPESFFILDLPIPKKNATLYDCFDDFTTSELLDGDNAWFNEKTGNKESVKKQIVFWNFPKILVITLKRFSADGTRKIQDLIDFPMENLNLSKYVAGYNPKQYVYDLYAVCNHSGGPMGGHYTAFVKNADNVWTHFNDSSVEIVDDPNKIVTQLAYCLFYRKKNNLL
jgi:ubiquitin C-terminal hydrolase